MKHVYFESFETCCSGRLISEIGEYALVYSRNPYGTHNLILCHAEYTCENRKYARKYYAAIRHGNLPSLACAGVPAELVKRGARFLVKRGLNHVFQDISFDLA